MKHPSTSRTLQMPPEWPGPVFRRCERRTTAVVKSRKGGVIFTTSSTEAAAAVPPEKRCWYQRSTISHSDRSIKPYCCATGSPKGQVLTHIVKQCSSWVNCSRAISQSQVWFQYFGKTSIHPVRTSRASSSSSRVASDAESTFVSCIRSTTLSRPCCLSLSPVPVSPVSPPSLPGTGMPFAAAVPRALAPAPCILTMLVREATNVLTSCEVKSYNPRKKWKEQKRLILSGNAIWIRRAV